MTQIKDLFANIAKREPQRYLFRHIEDEIKARKKLVNNGENTLSWLMLIGTDESRKAAAYTAKMLEYDKELYNKALAHYSELVKLHTSEPDQFDTFKSKVNQTQRKSYKKSKT